LLCGTGGLLFGHEVEKQIPRAAVLILSMPKAARGMTVILAVVSYTEDTSRLIRAEQKTQPKAGFLILV
jgi:hypothetical protein